MSKKYELVPYKSIGEFVFGMNRYDIQQILGEPISSGRYGFPVEDRFFDDYGFFYTMFSNKNLLEAVEFFPEFTEEDKNWSREVASYVDLPEADGEFDNEVTKPMEDRVVKDNGLS